MKKLIITAIGLFLFASQSIGQVASNKVSVQQGPEFKESKKMTLSSIIGQDDSGIYTLFVKSSLLGGTQYSLARVSEEMDVASMEELDLEIENEDMTLERLVLLKDKLYLFSSINDKSNDEKVIYLQSIDKNSLSANGDVKKLATIKYGTKKEAKSTNFDVYRSSDGSKVMVYYNTPYQKGEAESFGFHIFDDEANELWTKEITLPYNDDLFVVESMLLDNNGDVFVTGKVLLEKKDRSRKEPTGRYVLLEYSDNGATFDEYEIDLAGNFINSLMLIANGENELLCAGFFHDSNRSGTTGAFFTKVDRTTKQVSHRSLQNFDQEFISQDMGEKAAKKVDKKAEKGKAVGINGVRSRNLTLREDGGLVLTGEQYWLTVSTTTNAQGQTTTTYTYDYWDILVININPEGNIEWTEKVPKRQRTQNDGGKWSSYAQMTRNDKLYFIFNDNPKNLMYKGDGKWKYMKLKDCFISLAEVDDDGRVFRESLLGAKGKGVIARPKVSRQIGEDELLIYAERGKKKNFMKVKFLK
jgi:hypothetical protein